MAKNIYGGGSQTNANGLQFEQETSLSTSLANAGYIVIGSDVFYNGEKIAVSAGKNTLYSLLQSFGVDYKTRISKKLLPDEALYILDQHRIVIIEKKFQKCAGSVDEKLQTCDFKKREYMRLFSGTGVGVDYIYVCNDWFRKAEYQDVRDYIDFVGCHIFFNEIPLSFLGLPY